MYDTVFNPLKDIEEVQTGELTPRFPTDTSILDEQSHYAVISVQANSYVQHERYFRVTFWTLLANSSALALAVYSGLSFFLSYLNIYESEKAMIHLLY